MVTIADDLDSLSVQEPIFRDVKYYVSGDISEKITQLLQSGGAESTKYFSDYVTHLICGQNAADTDIDEAQDIYQIPAVTEDWVVACVRLKQLAFPKPYNPNRSKIFNSVVACVCKVSVVDAKVLFALITFNGGSVKLSLDNQCTHLICGSATGKRYNAALSLPSSRLKIVTPDWVLESLRARIQAVTEVFHPKLLVLPQLPPKLMDRISAITGFDFEEGIAKNEVPTQNMAENKDDSTQALLDKLKQRMPWNHPPSTASSSAVTTSGITSMGFSSSSAMPTSNIISKSIPHGIVTQNLQVQNSQANQVSTQQLLQKFGQNTIVSQAGMNVQGQQIIQQQQQPIYNQGQQQSQQQPTHGLTAIQIQQQKLLQQHQLRVQMLQQQKINNQQNQQNFQSNSAVSQITQNIAGQIQHNLQQSGQHIVQQNQNLIQSPNTSMSSAQQQIENISQMLSQSANNLQQAQLNQQNRQSLSLSQQTASQAVQNIAQQLAQSTQNLQQSLQNAKLNQNLNQGQIISQQLINSGQQMSSQNQGMMQQQTVQSMTNQQQNVNMGVVNQQGQLVSSSQAQQGQNVQLNQLVGNSNQSVIGQQLQTVQQNIQGQQNQNMSVQGTWRQQNIQMVQNVQGQHQIIRSPMVQSRNQQNQVILQQQIMQTQQQALINNQQQQLSPQQHTIQQNPQQIIQQSINSQGQISQTHHQILVQKQQLLSGAGQQQIVQGPQQVLINQHTGQQQILVHGNQQVTLQGGQQIVSQSQIVHQGGQIVNQGGQQILTQGTQVLSQGGQQLISQQGQQHQVVIAQSSQQIVTQSGQQIIGQTIGQGQQVLSQVPQSPQPGAQLTSGGGIQQIITHAGGQQIVSPGGQQIVQGTQNWQQQQYLQQRQQIGQPGGPRVSWSAGAGGRQLIHLDAQTHAQLQQMDPQQRAMFVAQLQKRRQLSLQRAHALAQQQQQSGQVVPGSPGAPSPVGAPQSVTFIRSQIPPGLTQQQQVQWLQQQGARTTTLPAAAQVQPPQSPVGGGPVASPVGAGPAPAENQMQQLQLQRQQQYQRLQQLQAQRDHVAHHHAAVKQVAPGVTQHVVGTAPLTDQQVEGALLTPTTPEQQGANSALIVNPKTKTALANMLSIRLQGTTPTAEHEPSAAGTLRMMTAAHAAGGAVRAPTTRLLIGPAHHTHQPVATGVSPAAGKVYAGVRAAPPRAQFYGHNPNLKLPPELFLLGCVFHIVEYQQSLGQEQVSKWISAIQSRGGEVENNYCARVTHVLCETQKHGVVMQALRDAKRCVTAYWLSDCMQRRVVAPPWQALQLPALYGARDKPAAAHRAALSGWRAEERVRAVAALQHLHAKITPYLTRDNTVLICKRADGNKYRRAREWGVPVVNATWLTDLLLGNMTALSQMENAKYQQFNLPSPFRMDYSLVSHLMNAWKMPINITQESHERAKRTSAALTSTQRRAKRPRLDDDGALPPSHPPPHPPPLQLAPRVLFSAVKRNLNKMQAIVRQLGGLVVTSAAEATHLVMEKLVRTGKLLSCLVTVKHLVTTEWVLDSQRQNKFADEAQFALRDVSFNKLYKADISEVLLSGEQRKHLFDGITFFITPCIKPSRAALTEMIELCGGKVEKNRRSYVSIREMLNQKPNSYLVLTVPNDLHLVYYLLQAEKALKVVCSAELVFSAIMRQKLDVEEFLVKID